MASIGQTARNRPALYKPTDFISKQKRSIEEKEPNPQDQVVLKIQQRPKSNTEVVTTEISTPSENSSITMLKTDAAKIKMPQGNSTKASATTKASSSGNTATKAPSGTKVIGVSDKDIQRIKQLNEFMAQQQNSAKTAEMAQKTSAKKEDIKKVINKDGKDTKDTKSNRPSSKNKRNKSAKAKSDEKGDPTAASANKQEPKSTTQKTGSAKPKSSKGGKRDTGSKQVGGQQSKAYGGVTQKNPAGTSSFYSQGNYGRSANQPWLSGPVVNNPGILTKPFIHDTQIPAAAIANRKTVPATKDKSEQKRSLDFVKNFFETDPEAVYHRQQKVESSVSKPAMQIAQSQAVNNAVSHHDINSMLTPMYNATLQDTHRSVSMTHNAAQLQTLMAHNTHLAQALPSSYSVYQQQQLSNLGVGNSGGLHHGTSTGTLHGTSPGTLHHSGTGSLHSGSSYQSSSSSNYHQALNHPSSMFQHQATGGYPAGVYSQLAQSTLLSPGSNYHDSVSNNQLANSGMGSYSGYSGYFPQGGHQSHVRHIQQELDTTAIENIFEETKLIKEKEKAKKKWQKTALTKCGPIDSKQARSLIEQLIDGTYECMVCCESVKWSNQVWNCGNCYHVFHLGCIRKWARSEAASVKDESGWRCPGCQNVSTRPPNKYYCFCGKVRDPDWNPRDGITPHSCGEVCQKKRNNGSCAHSCNELCHPGPCPSCPVTVTKHCPCGKTSTKRRCGQQGAIRCDNQCLKLLLCGQHKCQNICHEGSCEVCDIQHSEECFCEKDRRYVVCGTGYVVEESKPDVNEDCMNQYSCGNSCERTLGCGNHRCEGTCHAGDCQECPLLPSNVKYCPCGKVPVNLLSDEVRMSCLEPIPTCDGFCGKKLHCGPKGSSHLCMMKCHTGKCQPCPKVTSIQCRCGATKKEVQCKDLTQGEEFLCERKCTKKRKCGRHKCNQKCCTDYEHNCNIICGKKLSCSLHKCDEVCHTGFCPTCWRAGFDELSCHCGATVVYPPIACGTKPPDCDQPCTRQHVCEHEPLHTCHSEEICPPCTVLTTKKCMGGHETRKSIPCHQNDVSCGKKCAKPLLCRLHACGKKCHKGACLNVNESCVQLCVFERSECGHPCGVRCHVGMECPNVPCKSQVSINCRCGRRSANVPCLAGTTNSAYLSFSAELLTNQLHNLQSGQSIDLSGMTNPSKRPKFLDCDEECARVERNKRLAEALGIGNPDGEHFQNITFSPQLRADARSQLPFVQMLESVLENLVINAKKSSQSQIHHSFPSMNTSQRKMVHELAEAYGCKTYSHDQEPKRNTVAMASNDSYIPNVKLSTLVERDLTKNNPPKPIMLSQNNSAIVFGSMPLNSTLQPGAAGTSRIDYFGDEAFEE